MIPNRLQQILAAGEGVLVEYKEATQKLPKNLFETICAMLNREGVSAGVNEEVIDTVNDTVPATVNDTVPATVSNTVKDRMINLIIYLLEHPGQKSNDLAKVLGVTEVSIRRDIQKISKLVDYRGAPRTGGYALSQELHDKLHDKRD